MLCNVMLCYAMYVYRLICSRIPTVWMCPSIQLGDEGLRPVIAPRSVSNVLVVVFCWLVVGSPQKERKVNSYENLWWCTSLSFCFFKGQDHQEVEAGAATDSGNLEDIQFDPLVDRSYFLPICWSSRRKFRSQTSDNMQRWKSRGGKSQRGEVQKWEDKRWRKSEERRCRCAKR